MVNEYCYEMTFDVHLERSTATFQDTVSRSLVKTSMREDNSHTKISGNRNGVVAVIQDLPQPVPSLVEFIEIVVWPEIEEELR
jgi:hypothetical protein